jgi:hypothetical protein
MRKAVPWLLQFLLCVALTYPLQAPWFSKLLIAIALFAGTAWSVRMMKTRHEAEPVKHKPVEKSQ